MEIERKFIPDKLPDNLDKYPYQRIEQAYISSNPVIRIRHKTDYNPETGNADTHYILTVKSSGMMARQEFELELSEDSYLNLRTKISGNIISKKRYVIPLDKGLKLELDIFEGVFDGLIIGEIEFPSEEMAKKYTPPAYLAEEVTYDTRFHNSTLSNMSEGEISDLIFWIHKHN